MAIIRFEQESRLHAEERVIKENKKVKVLAEGEEILSLHGQRFVMIPLSLKRTIFIAEGMIGQITVPLPSKKEKMFLSQHTF